jgi:hypothetical protein
MRVRHVFRTLALLAMPTCERSGLVSVVAHANDVTPGRNHRARSKRPCFLAELHPYSSWQSAEQPPSQVKRLG